MARWRDIDVEVRARVVPRYFWTTASIDVYLDGQCLIRTGGAWKLKGTQQAEFTRKGQTRVVELSWRSPIRGMRFPYRLSIDGEQILDETVSPANWLLVFISHISVIVLIVIGIYALTARR
jgi:hypothetical protein